MVTPCYPGTRWQEFLKHSFFTKRTSRKKLTSQLLQKDPQPTADTTNPKKWIKWIKARCEICRREMNMGRRAYCTSFPKLYSIRTVLRYCSFLFPTSPLYFVHSGACHSPNATFLFFVQSAYFHLYLTVVNWGCICPVIQQSHC